MEQGMGGFKKSQRRRFAFLRLLGRKRSPEEKDVRFGRVDLEMLPSERLRDSDPSPLVLVQDTQETRVILREISASQLNPQASRL